MIVTFAQLAEGVKSRRDEKIKKLKIYQPKSFFKTRNIAEQNKSVALRGVDK